VPNFDNRLTKIEELLGAPGCVCAARREAVVILSEFRGPATHEELENFHSRALWMCPAHGQSHALIVVRLRLSNYEVRQPALTYNPQDLYGY
jgi:hypothetical protein